MTGDSWNEGIRIRGSRSPRRGKTQVRVRASDAWIFRDPLGAKIVRGRPITDGDTAASRKVAVINEAFATRFFKDQSPIGQHFGIDKIKYSATFEIVEVSRNMRYLTSRPNACVDSTWRSSFDDRQVSADKT
ncbi:MAG: ABC transporter permease [Acidobacteriaceae bacterium]|nr:ABC transporter permease [Acidobacteriaceae bacterium]